MFEFQELQQELKLLSNLEESQITQIALGISNTKITNIEKVNVLKSIVLMYKKGF